MPSIVLNADESGETGALAEATWFSIENGAVEITTEVGGDAYWRTIPKEPGIVISAGQNVRYRNSRKSKSVFGFMAI